MAAYTMYLWEVIARGGTDDDARYRSTGLQNYPVFDETYRETLNENIISHYLNEEIGHETAELFRQSMDSRMRLIMPYYNGLYESAKTLYDTPILSQVDMTNVGETTSDTLHNGTTDSTVNTTETGTTGSVTDTEGHEDTNTHGTSDSTTETGSDGTSESRNYSYPQQQLRSNGEYMTSAAQSDSNSTSTGSAHEDQDGTSTTDSTGKTTTTGDTTSSGESTSAGTTEDTSHGSGTTDTHTTGRGETAAELVAKFRAELMNIDQMIVTELEDLFMSVWTNGESFTNANTYGWGPLYTPYVRGGFGPFPY